MPKLQNIDDAAFMASVEASLTKIQNKVKMQRASYIERSDPNYWNKQKARKADPRCKSYDLLLDSFDVQ